MLEYRRYLRVHEPAYLQPSSNTSSSATSSARASRLAPHQQLNANISRVNDLERAMDEQLATQKTATPVAPTPTVPSEPQDAAARAAALAAEDEAAVDEELGRYRISALRPGSDLRQADLLAYWQVRFYLHQ
jgi:hypothetical protein